jgi:hypothetical protein
MNLPEEEEGFLRDLVKASRQKPHHVNWVDRDGTDRLTTLTQAEAIRLNTIASRLGTSKSEILRRAAHIPNRKSAEKPTEA